jgi:hypothetical protein
LVIALDPGNDEGYPVHVHIRVALEERPGSLKRVLLFAAKQTAFPSPVAPPVEEKLVFLVHVGD